jgi:hypothetical protein
MRSRNGSKGTAKKLLSEKLSFSGVASRHFMSFDGSKPHGETQETEIKMKMKVLVCRSSTPMTAHLAIILACRVKLM